MRTPNQPEKLRLLSRVMKFDSRPTLVALAICGLFAVAQEAANAEVTSPVRPSATAGASGVPVGNPPALLAVAAPTGASAASAQPRQSDSEKLAALRAEIPLLTAQSEIEKLKADIATSQAAQTKAAMSVGAGMAYTSPVTGAPAVAAAVSAAPDRPHAPATHTGAAPMTVTAIRGFDGVYRAILDVSGRAVSVGAGDTVSDGWLVTSVTESTVTLARGRESITLRA